MLQFQFFYLNNSLQTHLTVNNVIYFLIVLFIIFLYILELQKDISYRKQLPNRIKLYHFPGFQNLDKIILLPIEPIYELLPLCSLILLSMKAIITGLGDSLFIESHFLHNIFLIINRAAKSE